MAHSRAHTSAKFADPHNTVTVKRTPAVRFLTRTFRNVPYVRARKLAVRSGRSQRSPTVVWGGSRGDESWKTPADAGSTPTAAAGAADTPRRYANGTPTWIQRPLPVLFCLKLDNSCCYACYSCGDNCNVVVKLVQEYHCFWFLFWVFTSVLQKQFAANDMFLREANSYKRALVLKNSRQVKHPVSQGMTQTPSTIPVLRSIMRPPTKCNH